MLNRKDIRVRDPFIVLDQDTYYLYATTGERTLSYYYSNDLNQWEEGGTCFEIPEDFWAYKDVWAAEVHKYKEKFYLFVSLLGKNNLRGTQIAVANTPKGPFVPICSHPSTPLNQSCIDGTLYVENNIPYMIYSHDWPDHFVADKNAYVGEICYVRLSEDLTQIIGEPQVLFASCDVPISREAPDQMENGEKRFGSDAPFVQQLENGTLFLTWSPYLNDHYVVLGAVSDCGKLSGPWRHISPEVFKENGGHAMFFRDRENRLCMCIHCPEKEFLERATIFIMKEENGILTIDKEYPFTL